MSGAAAWAGRVGRSMEGLASRGAMRAGARPIFSLGLIVLGALMLRLFFFTGITYTMDQDEGIYLETVRQAWHGEYAVDFTKRPADYMPNPAEAFQFRYPMIFAPLAAVKMWGFGPLSLGAFSLFCSLGLVALTYGLARLFYAVRLALAAAALVAIFPLDVLFATRLMPDGPFAFFFWLALYVFVRGARGVGAGNSEAGEVNKRWWSWGTEGLLLAAGVICGVCYLFKPAVVFLGGAMGLFLWVERRFSWRLGWCAAGFGSVLAVEGLFYLRQGDPFLLNAIMNTRILAWKYAHETPGCYRVIPGVLNLWALDPTTPMVYAKSFLASLNPFQPSFWGWHVVAAGVGGWVVWRQRIRTAYVPLAWVAGIYLMGEFLPVRVGLFEHGAWVNHYLISQRLRYLTILAPPLAMLAVWSWQVFRGPKWGAAWAGMLLIAALIGCQFYHGWMRSGIEALDKAVVRFRSLPSRPIVTDHLAQAHINWRNSYSPLVQVRNLAEPRPPGGHYVLVGGSRGMDLSFEELSRYSDELLRTRDRTWQLLFTIPNPAKRFQPGALDLVVYYVP